MKYLLAASLLFALVSFLQLGPKYRITCLYLLLAIPASLTFRAESTWLKVWYPWLAFPVVLFRLAGGIEIIHRQTEGFRYWSRLLGSAFLIAGMFAGMSWIQSPDHAILHTVVELRRLLQIWLAAVFVVVELFWISQGGGWWRRSDHIAALFGVVALNHGLVSVLSQLGTWGNWYGASNWSWGIDALAYVAVGIRIRLVPSAPPS